MDSIEHQHQHHVSTNSRRGKWVFLGFTVVALFFLWTEHRAHFLGALPYLLVEVSGILCAEVGLKNLSTVRS